MLKTAVMRLALTLLVAGCTFQVPSLPVDPQGPLLPTPPISDLAPATPVGPASGPSDVPDLAAPPDLTTLPDLLLPVLVCNPGMDCDLDIPGGRTQTVACADDSKCDVHCGPGSKCTVECGDDAECICHGAGCTITGCVPMNCRGDTIACGGCDGKR